MIWKPKEKELTQEEAIALAKKDLAPFWLGSSPLLAPVEENGIIQVVPLDVVFTDSAWVLVFCDPFDLHGTNTLQFLSEWAHRYEPHKLSFLIVWRGSIRPTYPLRGTDFLTKKPIRGLAAMLDATGTLSKAFKAEQGVKAVLFVKGVVQQELETSHPTVEWYSGLETHLQNYLRSVEQGLPLHRPFKPSAALRQDKIKIDLNPESVRDDKFELEGPHKVENIGVAVSALGFKFRAKSRYDSVAIVAKSHSTKGQASKIIVEVDQVPAFDTFADRDLHFDEGGLPTVMVQELGVYHILKGLGSKEHWVSLSFSNPIAAPVEILRWLEA